MTDRYTIRVDGIPAPQARPRLFVAGGHARAYSPKTNWFSLVYAKALENRPKAPMDGPIGIACRFIFPRPKSVKKDEIWKYSRPDIDNLIKACMDALGEARWFIDDGRISSLSILKCYDGELDPPGAVIHMYRLPEWVGQ